jgi:hypothetical protein
LRLLVIRKSIYGMAWRISRAILHVTISSPMYKTVTTKINMGEQMVGQRGTCPVRLSAQKCRRRRSLLGDVEVDGRGGC